MTEQSIFTTGEIAKYCGVHYRTVIRWIEQGDLKAYQLPGRGDNRVTLADFVMFLKEHKMPVPESLSQALGKKKILIFDENVATARSLQRVIRDAGYEAETASDGFQAGILLTTQKPQLLLLDMGAQGVSAGNMLDFVGKNREVVSATRVLVLSGLKSESSQKLVKQGADDVVQKPVEKKELLLKIQKLLGEA